MNVKVIASALFFVFIVVAAGVWHVNSLYEADMQNNRDVLTNLDFRFTEDPGDNGFIFAAAQKYSDITFLDLQVEVENTGSSVVELKNPVVAFYLENVFILNRSIQNLRLMPGEVRTLEFSDLTFKTVAVENASLQRGYRGDDAFILRGAVTSDYNFTVQGYVVSSYQLTSDFEGRLPLHEVFGGLTQEDAADKILGLQGFTKPDDAEERVQPSIPLPF